MLAGLPQRPSAYNPYENPDLMEGRVDTVLKLMVRHNKITQAEADEARSVDIASTLSGKRPAARKHDGFVQRSEEHTSELQSRGHLVCRLLLEKKKNNTSSS